MVWFMGLMVCFSHWSSNEKTAVEEALGMSFCGKRAIAAMKHVGLNVAGQISVGFDQLGIASLGIYGHEHPLFLFLGATM